MARLAGVSKSAVSRIENGKGASFNYIDRVLAVLGLSEFMDSLYAFAQAARRQSLYTTQDQLAESAQEPIILRLRPGFSDGVAFEVQSGNRRLLCTLNVYDYTPHLQEDLFGQGH